ncbi:MAG: hypothetical protein ABL996_02075 [Micropepsaceae bacterium]
MRGTRGERVDPAGGSYAVVYDSKGRPARYTDEIGRLTQAFYDGRGRIKRYIYPELDEELIDYDDRNNPVKLTKKVKPSSCTPTCLPDQVVEAAYHTVWNKPLWVKDQLGRQSDFTYGKLGSVSSFSTYSLCGGVGRAETACVVSTDRRCWRSTKAPPASTS